MESAQWRPVLRYIRRIVESKGADRASDETLLERFCAGNEDVFASLVERHGPMVMGVCCRMLNDIHDAEDVFQATFLVLVRKARSIANPECLGPWLYGVAYRTALRARRQAAKRLFHERRYAENIVSYNDSDHMYADLRPILDEEIQRLPRSYRSPLVLCYFAGKTKEETARILNLPVGTVSAQLARAREKLRLRLSRRGVTLSGGLFAGVLSSHALATVSTSLAEATTKAALALVVGQTLTGGLVSAKVLSLTHGMVHSMFLSKLKLAVVGLAAAFAVGSGAGVVTYQTVAAQDQKADPTQEDRLRDELARLRKALEQAEKEIDRLQQGRSYVKVSTSREGVIALVGSELKNGEKLPSDLLVSASIGSDNAKYRRLRIGDRVEPDQLLGRVDDRLARGEMRTMERKLDAAKADLMFNEKTREVVKARLDTQLNLERTRATSVEDVRAAKLALEKQEADVASKKASVSVAEAELLQAQTVVKMHEIRSPVRGIIKAILKHPGESVQSLETVFVIQPEDK